MPAEELLSLEFLRAHPADSARVLERFSAHECASLLGLLAPSEASAIIEHMVMGVAAECVGAMAEERGAAVLAELSIDQAAALLRCVPTPTAERILAEAPARVLSAALRMLIAYPEGTAGALVDPTILSLPVDLDASEALERVRRAPLHAIYYLYVVDRDQKLVGVLNLRELMLAPPDAALARVMHSSVARLPSSAGEDEILHHPGWREYHALPVVEADGRFIGAIRYETLRRIERVGADAEHPNPALSAALSLGELYWFALRGMFQGMAAVAERQGDPRGDR